MTTYVNPPKSCDLCASLIVDEFSDAHIPAYDSWGNVCPTCTKEHGVRYGMGKGQKFQLQSRGFVKVEG